MHFLGRQTCKPLANAMTEFTPVVAVVEIYWSDSMNECFFSHYGRVFYHVAWECATSQSVQANPPLGLDLGLQD